MMGYERLKIASSANVKKQSLLAMTAGGVWLGCKTMPPRNDVGGRADVMTFERLKIASSANVKNKASSQ